MFEVSKLSCEKAIQQNLPSRSRRGAKPFCFIYRRIPIEPANYFFHFPTFANSFVNRWPLGSDKIIFSTTYETWQYESPNSGTWHTAPESVKNVKSSKQILLKNKMEAERLSQCWQKTLPKKFKPSWMPVKNGVLWWPELPPSAFVAFTARKMTLSG